jgi:transcriptional regulator of acetoin/glycerol metabolism
VALGLKREDRGLFNHFASKTHARRVVEESARLVAHASEELSHLYKAFGSTRWIALCTNLTGDVVCWAGDRASAPRRLQVLMQCGRSLAESELGTTAPGCALADGGVAVVAREEHYLHELKEFFCASAPIMNTDGTPAGVLDISGLDVECVPLAAELVALAARRTENRLLSSMPCAAVLRFHCDERLLDTPFEALLAVDRDARICGFNRAAKHLLATHKTPQIGAPLQSLFESDLGQVLRSCRPLDHAALPVRLHSGTFGFLNLARRESTLAVKPLTAPSQDAVASITLAPRPILTDTCLSDQYDAALKIFRNGGSILLRGPSGSGKQTLARLLHADANCGRAFVSLHCGTLADLAIEPILSSVSNSASAAKILFFDEISNISPQMQALLAEALERADGRARVSQLPLSRRLGLLCSTRHDLKELVRAGTLREDLYYRISGFTLKVPALHERSDLCSIVAEALKFSVRRQGAGRNTLPLDQLIEPEALNRLLAYEWPGNFRELEQTLTRLAALRDSRTRITETLVTESLGEARDNPRLPANHCPNPRQAAEQRVIQETIANCRGNLSAAARLLGLSRGTLYKRLKQLTQAREATG